MPDYQQFVDEAQARKMQIAQALAALQANGMGMIGGKPAAMGETYMTGPGGAVSGLQNDPAATAAFNHLQNMREQEMEDLQQRIRINTLLRRGR